MTTAWLPVEQLSPEDFQAFRRRAIFDCHKWDPQVDDVCILSRAPLVIRRSAWTEVVELAEALAREARAAEAELLTRPDLQRRLGLSRAVRRALEPAVASPAPGMARLIRFDFHETTEGWRISEANADVPGGLNEAAGFPPLMEAHYPWATSVGDPARGYVDAIVRATAPDGVIALVHATAYSDDHQMMAFIAGRLAQAGRVPKLASPAHLAWQNGRLWLDRGGCRDELAGVVRFFPGDWLVELPRSGGWKHLFAESLTPVSNPPASLLVQSKRFPLVWDALSTSLPTWRALLPETRDPREVPWQRDPQWLVKPALGRVGEGVGMRELIPAREWKEIRRSAIWWPGTWIAQRRFETVPVMIGGEPRYPCLGVYTVDARVVGAYGRLARKALVDSYAEDAAVLAA